MMNGFNAEDAEKNGENAENQGIVLSRFSLSAPSPFVLPVLRVEKQAGNAISR
jgi:hypothetical protein